MVYERSPYYYMQISNWYLCHFGCNHLFDRKHELKKHLVSHNPDALRAWGYSHIYLKYEIEVSFRYD